MFQNSKRKVDYEFMFVLIGMMTIVLFSLICVIGEIVLLSKFGNDECINKELRLTSLLQVFVCNIICYIFILTGAVSYMIKFITELSGYESCTIDNWPILLLVIPAIGFFLSGALSITEVYVFAYMAGKRVCTDPQFIEFVATTVSIKLFILIVCINIYFTARQTELYASRNSRRGSDPIEIIITDNFQPTLRRVNQGNKEKNTDEEQRRDLFRQIKSNTPHE